MQKYFFFLFIIHFSTLQGQNTDTDYLFIPDTINIMENWNDKNGLNTLNIYVNGACDPETRYFGTLSSIFVTLQNNKYTLKLEYKEENYQMSMILFDKKDISYKKRANSQITLIPFFYCGNSDSNVRVSYFILYNNLKYLKHIDFYCDEDGNCRLDDSLAEKLKDMPPYLRKYFTDQLMKYKNITNFHQDL